MKVRATIAALVIATGVSVSGMAAATDNDAERVWLEAHNAARAEFGVPPLHWDRELAAEALVWARVLAREERLRHSPQDSRNAQGENLWMGTAGAYSPESMIAGFVDEQRYFRSGQFPRVSTTGNWADVGHYTQIVWADTRSVGCASASGRRFDVLVCRYWPAGNVMGTYISPRQYVAQD